MIDKIIANEMVTAEKLRLIVNISSSLDNFNSIRDFITTKIGELQFVKLILSHDIPSESIEHMQEAIETQREKHSYLYNDIGVEERIQTFLESKKGYKISISDIKSIIGDALKDASQLDNE